MKVHKDDDFYEEECDAKEYKTIINMEAFIEIFFNFLKLIMRG
jgi:hypothetical protein